jgi:hypothetical protein
LTPFCLDCRTVLRGARTCDSQHELVDLATAEGRELLVRLAFTYEDERWRLPIGVWMVGAVVLGILAVAFAVNRYYLQTALSILGAIAFAGFAFVPRSDRRRTKMLPARAAPPWSIGSEKLVGTIVSSQGTRSPFSAGDCAGWVLEVSLSGSGITLRDGVTAGMTLELADGRTLVVPSDMLRLQLGAGSDPIDSDRITAHVASVHDRIAWDEARAVELRVGDRIEVVAPVREGGPSHYRDVRGVCLTAIDVPVIRRVTTR